MLFLEWVGSPHIRIRSIHRVEASLQLLKKSRYSILPLPVAFGFRCLSQYWYYTQRCQAQQRGYQYHKAKFAVNRLGTRNSISKRNEIQRQYWNSSIQEPRAAPWISGLFLLLKKICFSLAIWFCRWHVVGRLHIGKRNFQEKASVSYRGQKRNAY